MTLKVNTALAPAGGGSPSNTMLLQLTGAGSGVSVDWGGAGTASPAAAGTDPSQPNQPYGTPPGPISYTYAAAGEYTISICGTVGHFSSYNQHAITAVTSFGQIGVTDLSGAFQGASNLTSVPAALPAGVTSTVAMFANAVSFNGDITGWNTSSVNSMIGMFNGAVSFNQNLGGWNITRVFLMNQMLDRTALSVTNYDATLNGWAAQGVTANVGFSAAGVKYSTRGVDARELLRTKRGWSIFDAGLAAAVTPGSATITGTPKVGQTLTANPGTWTPSSTTFTYQWFRDKVAVPGATGSTYQLTIADLDHYLNVQVIGRAPGYSDATVNSPPTEYVTASAITAGNVTITGTPQVLRELKADRGTWSPEGLTFSYQWLANGVEIPGATFTNYFPVAADQGKQISVRITGSQTGFTPVSRTSAPTAAVVAAPSGTTGTPTIYGAAKPGSTLTALPGTWVPSTTTFTYQWLRDGFIIAGATKSTLVLNTTDVGHRISIRVTGTAAGYATRTVTSATVLVSNTSSGVTSGKATVTGSPRPGSTLTATPSGWTPSNVTFTYQWLRDNKAIPGATGKTINVSYADVGHTYAVIVYGAAFGYSTGSAYSASVKVMQAGINPGEVSIIGTPQVHSELRASWGTWTPSGVGLSIQWLSNGSPIPGAYYANYWPTKGDIGKQISVRVTGSLAGYTTVVRTSAPTAAVTAAPAITPGTPRISGVTRPGNTLTAVPGTWSPSNVTFTYQWLRDNQVVPGATGKTYKLTDSDVGHWYTVKVTGSAPGLPSIYRYSPPSEYINQAGIKAGEVRITGTAQVQRELRASWGTWTPSGITIKLQWLRNGAAIPGATYTNYYPTAADRGAKISVRVTGSKPGYPSVTKTSPPTAAVTVDVYTTPGSWTSGGSQYRTACEPYSKTSRCRTDVWATRPAVVNGKYVQSTKWYFVRMTYLPMSQKDWGTNPVARNGTFTSGGYQYRSECNTKTTGNGCYLYARIPVLVATSNGRGGYNYSWQWQWVLNSVIRFS